VYMVGGSRCALVVARSVTLFHNTPPRSLQSQFMGSGSHYAKELLVPLLLDRAPESGVEPTLTVSCLFVPRAVEGAATDAVVAKLRKDAAAAQEVRASGVRACACVCARYAPASTASSTMVTKLPGTDDTHPCLPPVLTPHRRVRRLRCCARAREGGVRGVLPRGEYSTGKPPKA